jgi:Co/Zn/Cd efflux system component
MAGGRPRHHHRHEVDTLEDEDLAPSSRARTLAAIKSLLAFGHRTGYLPLNVGAALKVPTSKNTQAGRILSETQVRRLLALRPNYRNLVLLRLLYIAGLRVSELAALRWRDLQPRDDTGQVTVFGEGQKTRVVLLPASVWRELEGLGRGPADVRVFPSRRGRGHLHPTAVERIVLQGGQAGWGRGEGVAALAAARPRHTRTRSRGANPPRAGDTRTRLGGHHRPLPARATNRQLGPIPEGVTSAASSSKGICSSEPARRYGRGPVTTPRTDPMAGVPPATDTRTSDIQRGVRLALFTVIWMVLEAALAIAAGVLARSLLLVAFGFDSVIELISGAVLLWRLHVEARGRDLEQVERAEQRATRIVAVALSGLCVYVLATAVYGLVAQEHPDSSPLGIGVSLAAVLAMPLLAFAKRRVARRIGSEALRGDAASSMTCGYMAATVLVGLALNRLFGWWWAEDLAALVFLVWLIGETREAVEEARRPATPED